jgi:N-acyl-D-amino-acid deacylase
MSEADVRRILLDPHVAVGSDGLYMGRPGEPDRSNPHPCHYATFARVLGHFVREEQVLALPMATPGRSSQPARVFTLAHSRHVRERPGSP